MKGNDPLDSLKPQPGQYDSYDPKFHPLPGQWAQDQLDGKSKQNTRRRHVEQTEIQRALQAEAKQHEYWEQWQGVKPGKPVYEDPRAFQNTLLPVARYGTEGR
jgi:hypothetical protein